MPDIRRPEDEEDAEFPREDSDDSTGTIAPRPETWRRLTAADIIRRATSEPGWAGDPDEADDYSDDVTDVDVDEAEPAIQVPGHSVMERAAIERALKTSGYNGSFDHLSREEEARVRLLLQHRDSRLFRPHLIGTPAMIARLEQLGAASPNFAAVTRLVLRAAHLSSVTGCPLRIPPVLMLGPPGTGKTRYARALAAALGTSLDVINGATIPDTGSLTGYPPVWRGAGPGRIAKALVAAPTSGPLIFVDEAEKINDYEASRHPLDRLLMLLEPESAGAFEDEHIRVPMRADSVLWLFACNSLDGLSQPLLDRAVTIPIADLSPEQRRGVLETMLAEVAGRAGLSISLANPETLAPIRSLGLRRCRLAFAIAIPCAVAQDRRFLTSADLAEAVALLRAEGRTPIGFLRPGLSSRD